MLWSWVIWTFLLWIHLYSYQVEKQKVTPQPLKGDASTGVLKLKTIWFNFAAPPPISIKKKMDFTRYTLFFTTKHLRKSSAFWKSYYFLYPNAVIVRRFLTMKFQLNSDWKLRKPLLFCAWLKHYLTVPWAQRMFVDVEWHTILKAFIIFFYLLRPSWSSFSIFLCV